MSECDEIQVDGYCTIRNLTDTIITCEDCLMKGISVCVVLDLHGVRRSLCAGALDAKS